MVVSALCAFGCVGCRVHAPGYTPRFLLTGVSWMHGTLGAFRIEGEAAVCQDGRKAVRQPRVATGL